MKYLDDGMGDCSNFCADGYQDNGNGICKDPEGCQKYYTDNGVGQCSDTCADGYYDFGDDYC